MGEDEVACGAERRDEMRTDESVSPGHENVFALKIHHRGTQSVPFLISPSTPVLKR
jgi:hypothetical protein